MKKVISTHATKWVLIIDSVRQSEPAERWEINLPDAIVAPSPLSMPPPDGAAATGAGGGGLWRTAGAGAERAGAGARAAGAGDLRLCKTLAMCLEEKGIRINLL